MHTSGAVLNTRPRDQSAELSRLLAAAGFDVLEAPAIETVPAWDPAELRAVRDDLAAGAYEWVVLPSQNAGRLLLEELGHGHALLVCGAATAQALGATPAFALDSFSASAALALLRPLLRPGQRILVPRAVDGQAELSDGLVALGAHVHAPIAYRTVAVEPSTLVEATARLRNQEMNAITACSPSAINSLLAALGRESLLMSKLICLGETTAKAARQAGLRVDGMAEKTTMASLVDAVVATVGEPPLAAREALKSGVGCSRAETYTVPA
jgi:uroporphyrinogen-III synthase